MRRNALVVIGNVGEPSDMRCREVLERYRSGPDPVLAEHARWALDRLTTRCRA
jgi:epoxyqueuosine reductase